MPRRHVTAYADDLDDIGLDWETVAPRIPEERFRIYCRAHDGTLTLIATCATPEAVGVAIVTLGREGEFDDCAAGVLDTMGEKGQKWVLRPWERSAQNVSVAGHVLAKAPRKSDR